MKQFYPDSQFLDVCTEFGKTLAEAINKSKKDVLIIASSDFSHYVPEDEARSKDALAMSKIEKMDEAGFFSVVAEQEISICGYGAITAVMAASKALGAKKGIKVAYSTLADTLGSGRPVVGYGSLAFV
jgi:MEMO1 family protein